MMAVSPGRNFLKHILFEQPSYLPFPIETTGKSISGGMLCPAMDQERYGWAQTDMLKIQLKATMPINTAHPIVRIMAAPNFLIIFLMLIFCKSNLNHK